VRTVSRRFSLGVDVQPSNIILADSGGVKLLDFGLAKLLRSGDPRAPSARRYADDSALVSSPGLIALSQGSGPMAAAVQSALSGSGRSGERSGESLASLPLAETMAAAMSPRALVSDAGLGGSSGLRALGPAGRAAAPTLASLPPTGLTALTSAVRGTPLYMAPEIWRGEPATFRSDIYSMGILLYELCTGQPPHAQAAPQELPTLVMTTDAPRLREVAPEVDARFAAVVNRCLQRDPAARYGSGEELRLALEDIRDDDNRSDVPPGNPYRGLLPFDAEHRGLFFGRQQEIGALIERLRREPLLCITADSGMGKTSLCRAGLLPLVAQGVLDTERTWSVAAMTPGAHPVAALTAALAQLLGEEPAALAPLIHQPRALRERLLRHTGDHRGVLLFVDQLEELISQSDPAEKKLVGATLAQLAQPIPGVRLLIALRSDYLARAEVLSGLGERLPAALYFLRPMSPQQLQEAIVAPARLQGVRFESSALIQDLVSVTHRSDGGLPLLQFALAALWEARQGDLISVQSLISIGGVSGALARYADQRLRSLPEAQRHAARKILISLVTPEGGRAQVRGERLATSPASRAALQSLTAGRLLIARDTVEGTVYELAHQALLTSWSTLRRWLNESAGVHAALQRLATATTEWLRLGRAREALWNGRRLRDAQQLASLELSAAEQAFLQASRQAVRNKNLLRAGLLLTLPLLLGLTYLSVRLNAAGELQRRVNVLLRDAAAVQQQAAALDAQGEALRLQALGAFDSRRSDEGERLWAQATQLASKADRQYANAGYLVEAAVMLDSSRQDARERAGDIFYVRAQLAERDHLRPRLEVLLQRLALFDEGGARRRRWSEPARLLLDSRPRGAQVQLQELNVESPASQPPPRLLGTTPLAAVELLPGSYVLSLTAPGRAPVRYPLLARRGESLPLTLELPAQAAVPPGFIYIPPGRFLFGSAEPETLRRSFLTAVPEHEVSTGAYLIAQHETTYADWIEFLEALPPGERARHSLNLGKGGFTGAVKLTAQADGSWQLVLQPVTQVYKARSGEPIVYSSAPGAGPARRIAQDWLRLPVSGISRREAAEYVDWLARTRRVPDARLCSELEWERAARGADGRVYPGGDQLTPEAANFDETVGRDVNLMGPREVGSYPASRSPFGVDDLAGNVFEWTLSALDPTENVVRGGGYFFNGFTCRATNRSVVDASFRDPALGLRVCATYKASRP
jgi:formylglycine-generating enzyme required for sulfatase activity